MIKIVKVTGSSLSPFFLPDDYALIWRAPTRFNRLSPGDFVVFNHAAYGRLIKRILHNDPAEQYIEAAGLHADSITSQRMGKVPYSDIIGKVLWSFHHAG